MIDPHAISWRFIKVWRRNLVTFQKVWKVNFITPLLEPLLFMAAFGLGFTGLVGNIRYGGAELSYTAFIAPALIATAVMNNAFFETTYASFVRMYYQKTFDGMLATPLSIEEIIIAEIVWSATKAAAAAGIMLGVLSAFGYIHFPSGLLVVPLAFLGGLAFGAIGLFFHGDHPHDRDVQPAHFSVCDPHVSLQRHLLPGLEPAAVGQASGARFSSLPPGGARPAVLPGPA